MKSISLFYIQFLNFKYLKKMQLSFKSVYPHLIAIATFVIVAVIFCKPALEGKVLQQSDNTQWRAMYEDQRKYEEKHGTLPLWSNGMFSGTNMS